MKSNLWISGILIIGFGCKKSPDPAPPSGGWDGNLTVYAPATVPKTSTKKVFVHYMPWFETPATNASCCQWGIHWTMNLGTNAPQTIVGGQRKIASHYYPMIGPYASSDTAVIDYYSINTA